MEFKEFLKEYKNKNNITVNEMAEKVNIPKRTLENWLSGCRVPDYIKQQYVKEILK